MGKRKDILIEFREYYNGLSADAQDVTRRLLFGQAKPAGKSASTSAPTAGRKSKQSKQQAEPAQSLRTGKEDAGIAIAAGGD